MAKQETRKDLERKIRSLERGRLERIRESNSLALKLREKAGKAADLMVEVRDKDVFLSHVYMELNRIFSRVSAQRPLVSDSESTENKLMASVRELEKLTESLFVSLEKEKRTNQDSIDYIQAVAKEIFGYTAPSEVPSATIVRIRDEVKRLKEERLEASTTKELLTTIILAIKEE